MLVFSRGEESYDDSEERSQVDEDEYLGDRTQEFGTKRLYNTIPLSQYFY